MKKYLSALMALIIGLLIFSSCEKDKDAPELPPELPPYESMFVDFSKFKVDDVSESMKAAISDSSYNNWLYSSGNIVFWNLVLGVTLVVPVASFYASFQHEPISVGNNKWEWTYDVSGFAANYTARLTGEILDETVKWEMFITKDGVFGHDEFKWFEGTSKKDRTGGQWTMYHSYAFQEEVLTIDWEMDSDEVGEITYTYVRELKNNREPEEGVGSFLTFGLQEGDYNAFYDLYFYDILTQEMVNVDIEWSLEEYFGRVKAAHKFSDENWHCWNSEGMDIACE